MQYLGALSEQYRYQPDYGIKVCMARDTVVVWQPTKWHGTGLAHCDPEADDPEFYQAGLSIPNSSDSTITLGK